VIAVTRLNGAKFYLNAELIQMIEQTPDTMITLVNEKKVVVLEPAHIVTERIIFYQRTKNRPISPQEEASHSGEVVPTILHS
jgi:flagellar protein FlbD